MSDIEFSAADSDPVSDVNPEEMAKLMADLEDLDDGLPKDKPKSATSQKSEKDSNRRVTFDKKSPPSSSKKEAANDEDDDWDADDLLYSDDETRKSKPPKKTPSPGATSSSSTKVTSPRKNKSDPEESVPKATAKSQLMADLFSDDSPKKDSGKKIGTSPPKATKPDKSKLMSDLFGGSDTPEDSSKKGSPVKKALPSSSSKQASAAKKTKDEITFDDDDDLLGGIGDAKPKSKTSSDSPQSRGFLDSLLAKSTTTEMSKGKKERSPEFVLDEKYKNIGKEKKEDLGFGDYLPSSGKSGSPRQRTPKKSSSDDPFDFLNDPEPRRRNPRSATQQKTFEIDDDDILGNVRSRRGKTKENKDPPQSRGNSAKNPSSSSKARDDDWLFGSSGSPDKAAKREMDEASVEATVDHESNEAKSGSPNKSQDWLGNLLSGSKKSPAKPPQGSANVESPNMKQKSPAQSSKSPTAHSAHDDYPKVEQPKSMMSGRSPVAAVVPDAQMQKTSEVYQEELQKQKELAELQTSQSVMQMKAHQEQLVQQQEAKLKALSQMKAQQDEFEAHMAQQLLQQQEEYAKLQASAMKRYQEAMTSNMGGFNLMQSVPEAKSDESLKELQVQLRSAEVDVARLTAELDLIRKQHSEEVAILEESYIKRHQMERDVWERTEQRLKEELENITSDFQAKIAAVQAEKGALVASHETQVANVKKEWSLVVDRTKQLYADMAERMKEEHSAALERMRYLKDLELNAAISASGHVKEVETVMLQLESNTANLTDLTATINTRHESALEITQRALKLKEKQLKESEAHLEASRAEAESERGRLNALITRLESTLMQQGSEVEQDRWKLSQEQMKTEMERKALTEERKHFQLSMQTERQNLASARESLMSEHKMMLQSIAQEKQELASQRAQLMAHEKVGQFSPFRHTAKYNQVELDAEMKFLNDEHRRLQEKMTAVVYREKHLDEEEERLEELSSKLEQEKVKNAVVKDYLDQEKLSLKKMQEEVESQRQSFQGTREEQQIRLSQIASQTQALHAQQDRLEREQQRLDHVRNEVARLLQLGQCPTCKNQGVSGFLSEVSVQPSIGRLPGDGGEGQTSFNKLEISRAVNMSPASVLARLAAARQHENVEREKRLLQLSALESS
ncbi:fas-binding factor 1-like isoform X1 [Macrobrachium rosenbergii]|uniref:fas-binding factor 1-like isoform X1 n=2 Tax=Macrobrachium rosenbergii TaxID=79674 RepID=UPI0034D6D78F